MAIKQFTQTDPRREWFDSDSQSKNKQIELFVFSRESKMILVCTVYRIYNAASKVLESIRAPTVEILALTAERRMNKLQLIYHMWGKKVTTVYRLLPGDKDLIHLA